ncbi:MAG TPA: response regulator [Candidatus Acidoferrales bacterium]|nr:response regulator [Candidatus Acidoferrales bacterium]
MAARILVVDDNAPNRELALYVLGAFGYQAEGAVDGLAGLEAATTGRFDLILLDILMPGIDGYEFARRFRVRDEFREVPVVAVTALAMAGDRERILESGMNGYIAKPIEPRTFIQAVEEYLPESKRASVTREKGSPPDPVPAEPDGPVVLVVDDVLDNLAFIRAALSPSGYRVIDASSVDEAIALVERVAPALVICDLHMPRRDGFDMLRSIRARADVPFVFISSTGWERSDRQRGMDAGVTTFLERPIGPKALIEQVRKAIGERGNDSDRR